MSLLLFFPRRRIPAVFFVCFIGLIALGMSASAAVRADGKNGDWQLRKSEDGIDVYTRSVEGSELQEFRAEMVLATRLQSLVALVEDSSAAPRWIYQCRALELIEQNSPTDKLFYMVTDAPWPVSDRDSVFRSLLIQDETSGAITIEMEANADAFPAVEEFLRIRQMHGFWQFIPQDDGMVEVIYQVHAEPGGGIPAWLANRVVVDNPYETLRNMRNLVQETVYRQAVLGHIHEMAQLNDN